MTQLALSFPAPFRCVVCGTSASSKKIVYATGTQDRKVVMVCKAHEKVCRRHLADPCPECDR